MGGPGSGNLSIKCPYTPAQLRKWVQEIQIPIRDLAADLGYGPKTVYRWAREMGISLKVGGPRNKVGNPGKRSTPHHSIIYRFNRPKT